MCVTLSRSVAVSQLFRQCLELGCQGVEHLFLFGSSEMLRICFYATVVSVLA